MLTARTCPNCPGVYGVCGHPAPPRALLQECGCGRPLDHAPFVFYLIRRSHILLKIPESEPF